jgi:mRNA-degrading endonuclease RelE of RelBE toxin-antitoxin system
LKFKLKYAEVAKDHLMYLSAAENSKVKEGIVERLTSLPDVATRNRFKMRSNAIAPWELRLGDLRVYYEIETGEDPSVNILAIGKKVREQVFIGGKAVDL